MTIGLAYSGIGISPEYDLVNVNGIKLDEGFTTSVILSLFQDARATEEELVVAGLPLDSPGGWWGDTNPETDGDAQGSKLWLLTRAKREDATLDRGVLYADQALAWMLDQNVAKSIVNATRWHEQSGLMVLSTEIQKPGKLEPKWKREWLIAGTPILEQ